MKLRPKAALVIGAGSIGRRHAGNLAACGVSRLSFMRTERAPVEGFPEAAVFTKMKDALVSAPDLVLICSPAPTHVPFALEAAKAGSHIFVEKPLATALEGIEELIAEVETRKLVNMVGFDLRFEPGLVKAKELIDRGAIGRVLSIQAQVGQYLPDWRPWQDYRRGISGRRDSGGGVIFELSHELDYTRWLGGPVKAVSCVALRVSALEIETEDTAEISLVFDSGAIGHIHLDFVQRSPSRTCRISGERGDVLVDLVRHAVEWKSVDDTAWQREEYALFDRTKRFAAEIEHLLACIEGGEKPRVDVKSAVDPVRLALAAHASANSGRVVEVCECPRK